MNNRAYTYALVVGVLISLLAMISGARSFHLPDNHQDYQPIQPIAFSHHQHAGQLAIDCAYCHHAAETSRHAGIPAASVCMNCHSVVTSSWGAVLAEDERAKQEIRSPLPITSPELQKLYDALALDTQRQPDPEKTAAPIEWIKIHNLPDYVYFDHRAHVNVGIDCHVCHGNVESMERVRQVKSLSMGWCVSCHRESNRIGVKGVPVNASLDCTTCHY